MRLRNLVLMAAVLASVCSVNNSTEADEGPIASVAALEPLNRHCTALSYPYTREVPGYANPVVPDLPSNSCVSMLFELSADGMTLRMHGTILTGDGILFNIYAKKANPTATVYLSSPAAGHSLTESTYIGYLIKLYRLKTHVPQNKKCIGGCAFAWAAGLSKSLGKNSSVGFVRPNSSGKYHASWDRYVAEYLSKLLYLTHFVKFTTSGTTDNPVFVTPANAKYLGVVVTFDAADQ